MEFFIKKIFEGNSDNLVHLQFQKFSRGVFKNRAMINAKNSKGRYSVSTTPEYANELVRAAAEVLGDKKTRVSGVVVSTKDLAGKLRFKEKKQFQGVKQYVMDEEMSGREIMKLCDDFPESFIALSFNAEGNELKIKAKAPKTGKPSAKGDETPKVDFCRLKTEDRKIINAMIFESQDFKEANVSHDFIIEEIEIPPGIEDPGEMRRLAKRRGKVIRKINIDGKEIVSEKNFVA